LQDTAMTQVKRGQSSAMKRERSALERITPDDLKRRIDAHERITIIDTRAPEAWNRSQVQLPGAVRLAPYEGESHVSDFPRDQLVVTYCTEPNERSSAQTAQMLLDAGWPDVRPLVGGFDAWARAGYPLQAKVNEMPPRSGEAERRAKDIQENLQKAEGDEAEEP
jgi:rhodanese-related sulfurtransferase